MASRRGLVDGKQRYKQGEWPPELVLQDLLQGNKNWRMHFKPAIDEETGVCCLQCLQCSKLISAANPGSSSADHRKACKGPWPGPGEGDQEAMEEGCESPRSMPGSSKRSRNADADAVPDLQLPDPAEGPFKNLVNMFIESETPHVDKKEGVASESKRARLATPGGTRPYLGWQPTPPPSGMGGLQIGGEPDILDYLKGRGEKVKTLEEEVNFFRNSHDLAKQELAQQQARIRQLEEELQSRGGSISASASTAVARVLGMEGLGELERMLDAELAKTVKLEQEMMAVKVAEAKAVETLKAVEANARAAAMEHQREVKDANLRFQTLRQDMKNMEAIYAEKLRASELELMLERRRRDTDQELHSVVHRQLQEVRAELASRDSQLKELQKRNSELNAQLAVAHKMKGQTGDGENRSPATNLAFSAHIKQLEEKLKAREAELEMLRKAGADAAASGAPAIPSSGNNTGAHVRATELEAIVRRLETELLDCKQLIGERDEQIAQLKVVADAAETNFSKAEELVRNAKGEVESLRVSEKSLERKLASVAAERDSLRQSLSEVSKGDAIVAGSASGQVLAEQQAARLSVLEGAAASLRNQIAQLENELEQANAAAVAEQQAASEAKEEARVAVIKAARLEKEADSLARDVAKLQEKLGSGQAKTSSMRVLHLKMNPESELNRSNLETEVKELREENKVLKEHLQSSAQAGPSGGDAGSSGQGADRSAGLALKEAENAVLQHRLSEMEKGMVRLKEVTKERIMAFREACYSLFGYRVDMTSAATAAKDAATAPTTFSLKPQHADDPSDVLVFKFTTARGMELVPTPFSGRLAREVDTFVKKFNCIPALTANLTMENFQKQTVC